MVLKRLLTCGCLFLSSSAFGVFIDGQGHYGLRPATQTEPGFDKGRGLYQATLQSFGLLGDIKAGDRLNIKGMFRVFENPRAAYLGDMAEPGDCSPQSTDQDDGAASENPDERRRTNNDRGNSSNCRGRHQDTNEPGYKAYKPLLTELYVEYGFDYCLLELGRRSRDWGMGMFLNSGRKPFSQSASIFDGVTCKVNPLNYETMGFSVGFDRLAETGTNSDAGIPLDEEKERRGRFGPSKTNDDLDQIFVTLEYDDHKIAKKGDFSRTIGIYVANVLGTSKVGEGDDKKKVKSDVKFADLYTALYFGGFTARHEVLFRLGKSSDPNWSRYGAASINENQDPIKSDVSTMGFAGELSYRFGESGTYLGPAEYNQGNAAHYSLFTEYGYAPGDRDGYMTEAARRDRNSKKVKAMAFNRNFKPALLLFNGHYELDDMRVDGAFDPGRIMNAYYGTLGFRYDSLLYGNFEAKFITAELSVSIPKSVKDEIHAAELTAIANSETPAQRPVGYSGRHLGYELDLTYNKAVGKNVELGGAGAVAIPGPAWRTRRSDPPTSLLLMGNVTFNF